MLSGIQTLKKLSQKTRSLVKKKYRLQDDNIGHIKLNVLTMLTMLLVGLALPYYIGPCGIKNDRKSDSMKIIHGLGLIEHPEGGYFKETYRSGAPPMESLGKTDERGKIIRVEGVEGEIRNEMTSMFWMATDEQYFLWMGVNKSPHVHSYQSGDPFTYILIYPDGIIEEITMGPDPSAGHVMQMVVPAGIFKAGYLKNKTRGSYFLVGEAVSPGFDFRDFKFILFEELAERIGDKAEKYRGFLHNDPSATNFDSFYT